MKQYESNNKYLKKKDIYLFIAYSPLYDMERCVSFKLILIDTLFMSVWDVVTF